MPGRLDNNHSVRTAFSSIFDGIIETSNIQSTLTKCLGNNHALKRTSPFVCQMDNISPRHLLQSILYIPRNNCSIISDFHISQTDHTYKQYPLPAVFCNLKKITVLNRIYWPYRRTKHSWNLSLEHSCSSNAFIETVMQIYRKIWESQSSFPTFLGMNQS